jgi:alanyl-tRNA synthetase
MLSKEIRRKFLQFFQKKDHKIVPSSPVIPYDDPTLMFINAGMNQFKDVFLGKNKRDYTRAVSSQKCIRVGGKHNDLENVGHTSRHLTFFEMLGNFSFGDYFKKEAIAYSFELTTEVFGFDPEFIWASVFEKDEESFELWKKFLPEKRIVRFGEKENFWTMGEVGPCGPCSELLFDRGEKYGPANTPLEDLSGERYLEFWNLVFMEFEKSLDGTLSPLPQKSIDTGAGLERVISLKMGVENVFHTDILQELIKEVEVISKVKYQKNNEACFHVIADHIRALSFAIADGVQPSNVDRGYVLRKILRRAVRYGRQLELKEPFLSKLLPKLSELMGEDFPELISAQDRTAEILETEEISFIRTLDRGGNILQQIMGKAQETISGEDAFKLKDTYGFPIEEIVLMAKDANLKVDLVKFENLEKQAKERSRKAHNQQKQEFASGIFQEIGKTTKTVFKGYQKHELKTVILHVISDEAEIDTLLENEKGVLILKETPFYSEMGGQMGDKGEIITTSGIFQVTNSISPFPGIIAHVGFVKTGSIKVKDACDAKIDLVRRKEISSNHTATHLLHWALEQLLGPHIKQAGSLVEDNRLRFDFTHHKSLSLKELRELEMLINSKIRSDQPVSSYELTYDEAQKNSSIKQFFGEKYGEKVRVIDIEFSKELCGGTHVNRLGEIGLFKIAKESSIAKGIRRIEAKTGQYAEMLFYQNEDLLFSIGSTLKVPVPKILESIDRIQEENQNLSSEIKKQRLFQIKQQVVWALNQIENVKGVPFIAVEPNLSPTDLNTFADELMSELKTGVIALGGKDKEKCQLLIRVSPDLADKRIHANELIKEVAPLIEGGGGGKKTSAQAGGKKPAQIPFALSKLRQILEEL